MTVMQKVLLRRGRGRTLLSKSHLIDFVQILSDNIPEAKFVDIVRHPKDSLVSWLALQQAGSRVFVRHEFPLKEAVQAHLQYVPCHKRNRTLSRLIMPDKFDAQSHRNPPPPLRMRLESHVEVVCVWVGARFWELFFGKEMEYFPRDRQDKTRVQLTFKEYCVGPDLVSTVFHT